MEREPYTGSRLRTRTLTLQRVYQVYPLARPLNEPSGINSPVETMASISLSSPDDVVQYGSAGASEVGMLEPRWCILEPR